MPDHPPDPVVLAEARRLAAEDLDRDLDQVAELLAEQGHYGPDGRPYPARTVANLLVEELRRRRDDRWRERNREAIEAWNRFDRDYGLPVPTAPGWGAREAGAADAGAADGTSGKLDAVATSYCVPADDYPLTPEECWFLLRGYRVRPAQAVTVEDLERMPGVIEMLEGYLRLRS